MQQRALITIFKNGLLYFFAGLGIIYILVWAIIIAALVIITLPIWIWADTPAYRTRPRWKP